MRVNMPEGITSNRKYLVIMILAVIIVVSIIAAAIKGPSDSESSAAGKSAASSSEKVSDKEKEKEKETASAPEDEREAQVGSAEQDAIDQLILSYRKAMADADIAGLRQIYGIDEVLNSDVIEATAQIVTGYENTRCYIWPGLDDDSRVVFIYDELAIRDLEKRIPSMSYVYAVRDSGGSWRIDPGEYDRNTAGYVYSSEIQRHIGDLKKSTEIVALYTQVNDQVAKLCDEDADVRDFVERLVSTDEEDQIETTQDAAEETSQESADET